MGDELYDPLIILVNLSFFGQFRRRVGATTVKLEEIFSRGRTGRPASLEARWLA
jgi:hypothetical protein